MFNSGVNIKQTSSKYKSDILGWDIVNWSKALDFWKNKTVIDIPNSKSLEIGAGQNGGISLWLAMMSSNVICSTWPENSFDSRIFEIHKDYGITSKVKYQYIDALNIPYKNEFDIVVFKSVLGGIGSDDRFDLQISALKQMYEALKPGGELFFAENLRSTKLHSLLRDRFGAGKYSWRYITLKEIALLFQPFSNVDLTSFGFLGLFGINESTRDILGKIDKVVFNKIIPSEMNYIVAGIARK